MTTEDQFVLGVDLDGVCADFYGKMREVVAYWRGVDPDTLPRDVSYGLPQWGVSSLDEYKRIHRYAVKECRLFLDVHPIAGCVQSLRRLSTEGVRIRVITHRIFISYFHKTAVKQTVEWLDRHAIPYWDLCFMKEKGHVNADIYIEDGEENIRKLEKHNRAVVAFTNSTNARMHPAPVMRAETWAEAEDFVRRAYYSWRSRRNLSLPPGPGYPPTGTVAV
ncbi:5' nucleotidase, NT5C type [Amycolatopsis suaedae]|uniref:5'-nucleotidase n=1 Tax=Amycolatopsis suaedae TaxID=2510978 RepID=A0A4Q7J8M0_9PSEU|nr:5'-nucleotidase [Amycolatopsis suaedae]RZQ62723.1 5'-nucleotidase [Amycolatopsis suaedae]